MPPFVPETRAVLHIDRQLRRPRATKTRLVGIATDALVESGRVDDEIDILLELRAAEVEARRSP